MSVAVRLPEELRSFLKLPGPQSLLIRGPPGSGKTTLSLAMLEASGGARVLVSSRVSGSELGREFPWLGENGARAIQVVDTSDMELSVRGVVNAVSGAAMVADADSHERRALSEFMTLPPPIQEAWSRLPTDGPATVVIDSWDALVEHYLGQRARRPDDPVDRGEIERMLLRWMGRSRAHLILVVEGEDQSQLDYLVNGIVVTRREMNEGRLERWLLLPKLRGIRVANSSYPYTVEGARFQCIEPLRPYLEFHGGHSEPEPDAMPGFIWPGSRSFSENFGRLAIGRLTLIEVDDEVPNQVVQHLIAPVRVHTIRSGGRALLIPSPSLSVDDIWSPLEGIVPEAQLANVFRVLDVTGQLELALKHAKKEAKGSLISVKSLAPTQPGADPQDNEVSRWLTGGVAGGPPSLLTMYADGLEALATTMKIPLTAEVATSLPGSIQATLGSAAMHVVMVTRPESPLIRPVKALAAIHLKLQNRQGRALLFGLKPWTNGFVLAESAAGGPYELVRIV